MIEVVTPPGIQIVELAKAKAHLRVDSDIEDTYIGGLISAATDIVETYLGKSLIQRILKYNHPVHEAPAFINLMLPKGPIIKINKMALKLSNTAKEIKRYCCDSYGKCEVYVNQQGILQIEYNAGMGAYPKNIPDTIHHAIILLTAEFYEKRSLTSLDKLSEIKALLSPFVVRKLI